MDKNPAQTIDEYLARIDSPLMRQSLERMRQIFREEMPAATERISYGIPTHTLNKASAHYAAFAKHCSFFPGAIVADFANELKDFKTSKGTVQFTPDAPIPDGLIRRMLQATLARYTKQ